MSWKPGALAVTVTFAAPGWVSLKVGALSVAGRVTVVDVPDVVTNSAPLTV